MIALIEVRPEVEGQWKERMQFIVHCAFLILQLFQIFFSIFSLCNFSYAIDRLTYVSLDERLLSRDRQVAPERSYPIERFTMSRDRW